MKCKNFFYWLFLFFICISCASGNYTYNIKGQKLDFRNGTWLLNTPETNTSKKNNKAFSRITNYSFKEILGDSLLTVQSLKAQKLLPPKINFSLSKSELIELRKITDCDFLINVKGIIESDYASEISFNNVNQEFINVNQTRVSVKIYDLKNAIEISSSEVIAQDVEEKNKLREDDEIQFTANVQNILRNSIRKLSKKYRKNQVRN